MAVSIVIDITQNSQSIANNTSNVTVKVNAKWTGGSYNLLEKSGSCTIDGTKYTFTSPFNTGRTTSGSCNLFTKTLDIAHNSNGAKTLAISASYTSGVSSGTVVASANVTLTTIPRKSTLTVANGTLGTAQTLTISEKASAFVHKLYYTCGNSGTVYILGSASATSTSLSTSWTPPIALASNNQTGTTVSIKFTLATYNGTTLIGSNGYTKTFTIPSSVKPSCTVTVEDVGTMLDGYYHLQGLAKLKIKVTPTTSYGSQIASYKTVINGKTYTSASFTTDAIDYSGTLSITSTVTDNRGRSGSSSQTIQIEPYFKPKFNTARAFRAINVDGNPKESPTGDLIFVEFNSAAKAISGSNTANFSIEYKKASDTTYTSYTSGTIPENLMEDFTVPAFMYGFSADPASSYDVLITWSDDIAEVTRKITVSSAAVFMSWHSPDGSNNYDGLAFGKVAEESDLFDLGWSARFNKPVYGKVAGLDKLPAIPANSDLNDYMETGCWSIQSNATAETIANIPVARAGRLEVISSTGEGIRVTEWSYLRQRFTPYNAENAVWQRDITRSSDNVWRYYDWYQTSLTPSAAKRIYSKAAITISLSANATLGAVNTYTQLPLNKLVASSSDRLTLQSNSIRIGSDIDYVKVSGQTLVKCGSVTGNRHLRIQKVSGSTTSSHAWACAYGVATSNTVYSVAPIIIPVKEGDLLRAVFYTSDATDSNQCGSAANGWQTYLTAEEL